MPAHPPRVEHDGEPHEVKEFLDKILVVDFNPT